MNICDLHRDVEADQCPACQLAVARQERLPPAMPDHVPLTRAEVAVVRLLWTLLHLLAGGRANVTTCCVCGGGLLGGGMVHRDGCAVKAAWTS